MALRRIHVAVLDTDVPVPRVFASRGLYSSQFRVLLKAAAARLTASGIISNGPVEVETTAYDSVGGVFPPLELLRTKPRSLQKNEDRSFGPFGAIDAILITGSSASAYQLEKYPWIVKLQSFIQTVYNNYPEVKIFGSCFGHQIVAQALLSWHNPSFSEKQSQFPPASANDAKGYVSVAACPSGYEVGIFPIKLRREFTKSFASLANLPDEKLRIQLIHGDRVMPLSTETTLPAPWINIGSTEKSPIQGLYYPKRILTYQGHFEFDAFVNRETCIEFARRSGWPASDVAVYLDRIGPLPDPGLEDDDDSKLAAEVAVLFLAGEEGASTSRAVSSDIKETIGSLSGMITPPLMDVDRQESIQT